MKKLPQARNEKIVVQHLNDEVLIYDLESNKAVCLNSTSAVVFNHCDGKTTFDDLKTKHNFNDDLIYFTLDKLNENNLLSDYQAGEHFDGLSRREVIKRVGMGSMIALPVIAGLIAPSAAYAVSGRAAPLSSCSTEPPANVDSPGSSTTCASGNCYITSSNGGTANGPLSDGPKKCCVSPTNTNDRNTGHNLNNSCLNANVIRCCSGTASPGGSTDPAAGPVIPSCICD